MLEDVLDESSSTDEFVHGLFSFLTELSINEPDHPVLSNLAADLGRTGAEAASAGLMHDVRSLLQIIRAHLDVMHSDMQGVFDPAGLDPGQRVAMFARFMDGLAAARDATATASKVAQGGLALYAAHEEHADTAEVLDASLDLARRMLSRRTEISLESSVDATVAAPRADLIRVLMNLIRNAGDAVSKELGGMVILSGWRTDENVFIQVADNGPGIPHADADHIFELFYTTKGHGTGVGLYVCKLLVTGWGGDIHLANERGKGARFTFSVPLVEAE